MDDSQMQTTLNIPSLVIFGIISVFAIRYFFFGSTSAQAHTSSPSASSANSRRQVPYEKIEMVASMFPQLNRRDIEWDLLRNGGSVQSTSEKMLRQGRLDPAPPNFRAQEPPASAAATAATGSQRRRIQAKPEYQDLITRYGLSAQVAEMAAKVAAAAKPEDDASGEVIQSKAMQKEKGGWTGNKDQRQALLKRRRDEMILAARRRMEEQDKAGMA